MDFRKILTIIAEAQDDSVVPAYVYEDDIHNREYILRFESDVVRKKFDNVFRNAFVTLGAEPETVLVDPKTTRAFPDVFHDKLYYELEREQAAGDEDIITEVAIDMFSSVIMPMIDDYNIDRDMTKEDKPETGAGHKYKVVDKSHDDVYYVEFDSGADLTIVSDVLDEIYPGDVDVTDKETDYKLPAGTLTHLNKEIQKTLTLPYGPVKHELLSKVAAEIFDTIKKHPVKKAMKEAAEIEIDNSLDRFNAKTTMADLAQFAEIFKKNSSEDLDIYTVRDYMANEYRHEIADTEMEFGSFYRAVFKDGSVLTVKCLAERADPKDDAGNISKSMKRIRQVIESGQELVISKTGEVVGSYSEFGSPEEAKAYLDMYPDGVITNTAAYDEDSIIFIDKNGNYKFWNAGTKKILDWDWESDVKEEVDDYSKNSSFADKDIEAYLTYFVYYPWDEWRGMVGNGEKFEEFIKNS